MIPYRNLMVKTLSLSYRQSHNQSVHSHTPSIQARPHIIHIISYPSISCPLPTTYIHPPHHPTLFIFGYDLEDFLLSDNVATPNLNSTRNLGLYQLSFSFSNIRFLGRKSEVNRTAPETFYNMPGLPCKNKIISWLKARYTHAYTSTASVDLDRCIESLYKKTLLAESVIEAICAKTKELLMQESNVVHVQAPVTVVGDIHGQFFDLIEIFKIGGFCPDTNYLFLGIHAPHSVSAQPSTC